MKKSFEISKISGLEQDIRRASDAEPGEIGQRPVGRQNPANAGYEFHMTRI